MDIIVEREIDGTLYKARYKGMRYAFYVQDLIHAAHSDFRLTEILFADVLVSPQLEIDDFDDLDALDNVRSFLLDVALGNIEKPLSKNRLKRQVDAEWSCWRLLYCDIASFDYDTVFNKMTPIEIEKANIALDRAFREIRANNRK